MMRFMSQRDIRKHHLPTASDPAGIRTRDPQLRRLLLYPTELPDLRARARA